MGELTPDGLKVDIVFEQDASDPAESTSILPHRQILQLEHVHFLQIDLPVDDPLQIPVCELRDRMGNDGCDHWRLAGHPYDEIQRFASDGQLAVRLPLIWMVQKYDNMKIAEFSELHCRLIHEDASP